MHISPEFIFSVKIVLAISLTCIVCSMCFSDDLNEVLGNYIEAIFPNKVRLLRSKTHLGLIRGRLMGTKLAKGQVVVSMDSHMEVQEGW